MVCNKCGTQGIGDAAFCHKCGSELVEDTLFCIKCGAKIADEAEFCHKCGTKVIVDVTSISESEVAPATSKESDNLAYPQIVVENETILSVEKSNIQTPSAEQHKAYDTPISHTQQNSIAQNNPSVNQNLQEYIDNHIRTTTKYQSAEDILANSKPGRFAWLNVIPFLGWAISFNILNSKNKKLQKSHPFIADIDINKLSSFLELNLQHLSLTQGKWEKFDDSKIDQASSKLAKKLFKKLRLNTIDRQTIQCKLQQKRAFASIEFTYCEDTKTKEIEKGYNISVRKEKSVFGKILSVILFFFEAEDLLEQGFGAYKIAYKITPILNAAIEYYIQNSKCIENISVEVSNELQLISEPTEVPQTIQQATETSTSTVVATNTIPIQSQQDNTKENKRKILPLILAICFAVFAIIIGVVLLLSQNSDSEDDVLHIAADTPEPTVAATPEPASVIEEDELTGIWVSNGDFGNSFVEMVLENGIYYSLLYNPDADYLSAEEGSYTADSKIIRFEIHEFYAGYGTDIELIDHVSGIYEVEYTLENNTLTISHEDIPGEYVVEEYIRGETSGLWSFGFSEQLPDQTQSIADQYRRTVTLGNFSVDEYGWMGWHPSETDSHEQHIRRSNIPMSDFLAATYLIVECSTAPVGGVKFAWVGDAGDDSWPWTETQVVPDTGSDDKFIVIDLTQMNGYREMQRNRVHMKIYIGYWSNNINDLGLIDAYFAERIQ